MQLHWIPLMTFVVHLLLRCKKCIADKGDYTGMCICSCRLSPRTILFDLIYIIHAWNNVLHNQQFITKSSACLDGIWPSSRMFFHIHEAYRSFACYITVSECKQLLTNACLTFNCQEFIKRVVVVIWPPLSGMSKGVLFLYVYWACLVNISCFPYIFVYTFWKRS
jgi:hypothetical protein